MKYPIGFTFYYRTMEYTIDSYDSNNEKQYQMNVKMDADDDEPFKLRMSETELDSSVANEQLNQ